MCLRGCWICSGQTVFEWDQTLDEVNIYINLPPNVHPKQFYCKIQSKHVEVGIKGNPPYLNVSIAIYFIVSLIVFFSCNVTHLIRYVSGGKLSCLQHGLTCPVKTDSSFWTLGRFYFLPLFLLVAAKFVWFLRKYDGKK